jgi:putative ABC transport system permease protein
MRDLRFWRWRQAEDDDVERELEIHLALEVEEQLERGVPLREAKLAARREFGSVALTKEELRDMRMGATLERLPRELRHAARRLVRSPAFTLAAVLTLALAIGANVAIFAVVYRVVLNPLPYGDSGRLVALDHGFPSRNIRSGVGAPAQLYYQYLDRAHSLEGLATYRADDRTLTDQGMPERVRVSRTSPSLVRVLRISPEHGRWFTEEEGAPGAAPVAVLSHGLWVRRYSQDRGVLGRLVTLDGVPTSVVGVMPPTYGFPDPRVDIWIPDPMSRAIAASSAVAGVYDFSGVARLREGVAIENARLELTRLATEMAPANPGQGYDQLVSTATTLIDATVGPISRTLWILVGSIGLVLLVACANVANLFLVRSEAKQREVAVRRALGAGSGGIAGYFLAESAWLAVIGSALGLVLAAGAVRLLVALGPSNLPRIQEIRLDGVALAYTVVLSVLIGAAFGFVPIIRLGPLAVSLHEGGRGNTASQGRHRVRHVLMGGQMALALVLLVSSGLMLRSFQNLRAVNPGFDATSALTFRVGLPRSDYPNREKMVVAHRAILDRLATLPGVTAVSASTCVPLSEQGCLAGPLFVEGRTLPPGANPPLFRFIAVAGGYFETMGTRVIRGRGIDRNDIERQEPVVLINEALVNIAFPNQDPIGQRVRMGNPSVSRTPGWLTVAGVVSNTSFRALAEATPVPIMYMPMFASRVVNIVPPLDAMSYVVRTAVAPEGLTASARRAIGGVDAHLALAQVRTLQEILDRASAQMAFTMVLLVIAASVALLLGVIGIYGVMSYIVSQRTGEIGVRLALGATPASVAGMIVRQGGLVALAGIAVGLATAFVGSRLIESLLYGISPRDPAVFAATTVILLGVALLACWVPARRAAGLSPLEALRTE